MTDIIETQDAKTTDYNGFVELSDNPISKVGVFEYWGHEIDAPIKDKLYKVYRPAEELSSVACMDSFRGLPFTIHHKMLGQGQTPVEERPGGVDGSIGDKVYFKDNTLYANIHAWTDRFKSFIEKRKEQGQKVQLSAGYYSKYDFTSGSWNGQPYDAIQRFISGNHLAALTGGGRCGESVAVQDEAAIIPILNQFTFTLDNEATQPNQDIQMTPEEISALMAAQLAPLIKTMDEQAQALTAIKKTMDEAEAEDKDDEKKEDEADDKEVEADEKKATEDAAAKVAALVIATQDAAVKQILLKDDLVKIASPLVGTFDHSAMTAEQVAKYAADKLSLSGDPETALRTYAKVIGTKQTVTLDNAPADKTVIKIKDFN